MDKSFRMFIETEVPEGELIISRTDLYGVITYANETFAEISGYKVDELIGKPHNIIRHPDMPKSAFRDMWKNIKEGKTWRGCVKNLRKDRGYYWVYTVISGVYKHGKLVEFKSMRSRIAPEMKIQMQKYYDTIREREGDKVRTVLYLKNSVLEKLGDLAISKGVRGEKFLEELITNNYQSMKEAK